MALGRWRWSALSATVRRIARNAAWLFSAQTAARLIAFGFGTVLARALGVEQFGVYTFVMTYVLYFAFVADAGLGRYLIRDAARDQESARTRLGSVIGLRLVLAGAAYALGLALAVALGTDGQTLLMVAIAGLSLFGGALTGALNSMLVAREEMRISALFQVFSTGLTAVAALGALGVGLGVPGIIVATTLANLPPLWMLVRAWRQRGGSIHAAVDRTVWWAALRQSFPYALLGVIGLIYFRIDALLLAWLEGPEATGIYTAAYRLLDAATDVPGIIVAAMFPMLARLHVESKERLRKAYLGALAVLTLMGIPVLIGMLVLARPLILALYGPAYEESVVVLRYLAVAVFLIFVDTANTMVLYAGDNLRPVVWLSAVTTAANVTLCLVLIPRYGETGAAVAMIGSTAVSILIFTPVVLRSLRA